jgi:TetR/AcrR family transcriptional repressor of nem operon
MKYDPEHKSRTRERILQEASAAIRAGGSDGVSIAAIMKRAGLTVGGFYAHFASKDEMIGEAVAHMFEERYAAFLEHLDQDNPAQTLAQFIDRYLSMRHRDAPERGCPIPVLAGELWRMPEIAQQRFMSSVARLSGAVQGLIERIGLSDAKALASSSVAEMIGALSLSRMNIDRIEAEALLETSRCSVRAKLGLDPIAP